MPRTHGALVYSEQRDIGKQDWWLSDRYRLRKGGASAWIRITRTHAHTARVVARVIVGGRVEVDKLLRGLDGLVHGAQHLVGQQSAPIASYYPSRVGWSVLSSRVSIKGWAMETEPRYSLCPTVYRYAKSSTLTKTVNGAAKFT